MLHHIYTYSRWIVDLAPLFIYLQPRLHALSAYTPFRSSIGMQYYNSQTNHFIQTEVHKFRAVIGFS